MHPSARTDVLTAVRHRAFMAPRLFGSLIALSILPIFLALRGVPTPLELVVLAWMVVPIATAYFLSRTGRYESAHVLSAFALTTVVTVVAANSGGINSFAAIWLVLVPLEGAASGRRRVVAISALLALGAAGFLIVAGSHAAFAPEPASGTLAALGIVSAALYATGIALGAELDRAGEFAPPRPRGRTVPAAGRQYDRRHHPARAKRPRALRVAERRSRARGNS